jgi:hypothetical protein
MQTGDNLRLFLIAVFGAVGTLARYALEGVVQLRMRGTFPYATLLINLINRTIHAEPHADFTGLARGDCRGIFRRLHHVFRLWVGNCENAGRRRMAARDDVRGRERVAGLLLSVAGIRLANRF